MDRKNGSDMQEATALEDIAIGEVPLTIASATIAKLLERLDDRTAHALFEALQSWTWKTLDARRRDDDLIGWTDVVARVASFLASDWGALAVKLEGYVDLLHTSVMVAATSETRSPLERKHVRTILLNLAGAGGRMRRTELRDQVGLKEANLSRVMAPLQDMGWIARQLDGREANYKLTESGLAAAAQIKSEVPEVTVVGKSLDLEKIGYSTFGTFMQTKFANFGEEVEVEVLTPPADLLVSMRKRRLDEKFAAPNDDPIHDGAQDIIDFYGRSWKHAEHRQAA